MPALATIKINNLIHHSNRTTQNAKRVQWYNSTSAQVCRQPAIDNMTVDSDSHSISTNVVGTATHPPHIIQIKNLEPLRLAKKKHYIPTQSALKIQKKTGGAKPQGRPFNDTLNARFLCFNSIDDLIANILNQSDQDTVRLLQNFPIANNGVDYSASAGMGYSTSQKNALIDGIIQSSKELNLKDPNETTFKLQFIEFEKCNDYSLNIHHELCQVFNLTDFSFVKIIRNNKGRLVKFEILSKVDVEEIDINFIKKFITYPRYKSKMKIFMINCKFDKDVWFYNDLRMLFWDIEHHQVCHKKVLINNKILK